MSQNVLQVAFRGQVTSCKLLILLVFLISYPFLFPLSKCKFYFSPYVYVFPLPCFFGIHLHTHVKKILQMVCGLVDLNPSSTDELIAHFSYLFVKVFIRRVNICIGGTHSSDCVNA